MSRELTIEAEGLNEAMEKAQTMMSEPIPRAELTYRKVYFDNIREDGKEFVLK